MFPKQRLIGSGDTQLWKGKFRTRAGGQSIDGKACVFPAQSIVFKVPVAAFFYRLPCVVPRKQLCSADLEHHVPPFQFPGDGLWHLHIQSGILFLQILVDGSNLFWGLNVLICFLSLVFAHSFLSIVHYRVCCRMLSVSSSSVVFRKKKLIGSVFSQREQSAL